MHRPIGIDLFAGAGGLSLGFEQAGFDVVAAVEVDPVHCAAHKFNFPNSTIVPRSVTGLTGAAIRAAAGIGVRTVECVFGGPPCQGFSLIGHRSLEDPRNSLVSEFVRIVVELEARTFVFENVRGLTVGRHKAFLNELVNAFEAAGYEVRLPWCVLDAVRFGVPQRRERLFLLGSQRGSPVPNYPPETTSAFKEAEFGLPRCPTSAEAIGDIPDADGFPPLSINDAVHVSAWGAPSRYAAEMRCLTDASWHFGYARKWNQAHLTSSWRTQHTEISRHRFAETNPGTVEPISRFYRLRADGVSNTLRAGTDGARGAFTSPRPIHYRYARCVTVREMARLHGFPDWFRFHSTKWHGARQVGNAVPPPLARAVASQIAKALGVTPSRPEGMVPLEDEWLLYLEMVEAAEHFGVVPPSGRRDRKSGARKRKQAETEVARLQALGMSSG